MWDKAVELYDGEVCRMVRVVSKVEAVCLGSRQAPPWMNLQISGLGSVHLYWVLD